MKILSLIIMGGKQSSITTTTTTTSSTTASTSSINAIHHQLLSGGGERQFGRHYDPQQQYRLSQNDSRQRARSLSHVPILASHHSAAAAAATGSSSGIVVGASGAGAGSRLMEPTDSDGGSSTGDESAANSLENALFGVGRVYTAHSLPTQLSSAFNGIKCPVCGKFVIPDDLEYHLVMCLTKPRISYNEDVLNEDKGECVICLDDLQRGDTIARLPCLCIYHKYCIDSWFEVNRSCPEHPSD